MRSDPPSSTTWIVVLATFALLLGSRGCQLGPTPGPGPTESLRSLGLLIVEDPRLRTPEQAALLTSPEFRQWATSSCKLLRVLPVSAVGPDGQPSTVLEPWRRHLAAAGTQGAGSSELPAVLLVRSDGSVYRAARLPDSLAGVRAWAESQTGQTSQTSRTSRTGQTSRTSPTSQRSPCLSKST